MTEEIEAGYIGFSSIIDAVCEVFGVTEDELMCHNRARRLTYPRFAAYYLAWLYTRRSMSSVGIAMGRDHTTILYGRAFEIELRKELAAQEELAKVQAELRQEIEIASEAQRKLEEARQALSKKGVLSGDKVIFPRLDAVG